MYGNVKAGNCIPYGTTVTLTRQSEVDSFPINYPGCDVIQGYLSISGDNITNLNGLKNLHKINTLFINTNPSLLSLTGLNKLDTTYSLEISNNPRLLNLNGLNSLKYSYYFTISGLHLLQNLTGLDSFEYSGSRFEIGYNDNLINLTGLISLKKIFSLYVHNNKSLIDLNGLQNLRYLDNFDISQNDMMINLVGLDSVTELNQHCYVYENNSFKNFYGLQNVEQIHGSLAIGGNPSLVNFSGLENIKLLNAFDVYRNNSLKNFSGLNSLKTIEFNFSVFNNPSLENFAGLNNLINFGYGGISIYDNTILCSINELNTNLRIIDYPSLLYIRDNPNLSCCNVADRIIHNNRMNGVYIANNAPGCNDTIEIKTFPNNNCCTTKYTLIKDTICSGEHIVFNNQNYSTTGTYYDTITNNGIDSIIILQLMVYSKSYQITNKNFCIGQSFTLSNGKVITTNGIYNDTLQTIFGCDSIIEYHLNFLSNITTTQNPTICKGKTYTLPKGNVVRTSGIYRDTLQASFGCDSIVITNLSVAKPIPFINNVTICSGKTFTRPNGNIVSTTGTYYDTIKAPNTCDSIVITDLTVSPYLQSSQISSVCLGKSFILPSGEIVNQSGIYKDTIKNNNGCDSIITTNLTITNPIAFTNTVSICDGQSYTLPNGNKVNIAAIYTDTIRQANTCDSIVITDLSVFPNIFTVSLNATDTIESGNLIELQPIYSNGTASNWSWSPNTNLSCVDCEIPAASPVQTTQYLVNVKSTDGCEDTAQTKIVVRPSNIYIPQAFTPNGDGINDVVEVFAVNPKLFSMKIYNRWGEQVFESTDVNKKWDGIYKGENCPVDSYSYILDVTLQNDKQYHKQSSILLLR